MNTSLSRSRKRRSEYPFRWKYPLNLLGVGEEIGFPIAAYWPVNAARTRAEKRTGRKFSIRQEADSVLIKRMS